MQLLNMQTHRNDMYDYHLTWFIFFLHVYLENQLLVVVVWTVQFALVKLVVVHSEITNKSINSLCTEWPCEESGQSSPTKMKSLVHLPE